MLSKTESPSVANIETDVQRYLTRNYSTILASYNQHGSDSILSPQCNSWKVIHFSLIIWVYKVCFWIFCNKFLSDHLSNCLNHFAPDSTFYSSIKNIIFVIDKTNKQNGRYFFYIKKIQIKIWFNMVNLWKKRSICLTITQIGSHVNFGNNLWEARAKKVRFYFVALKCRLTCYITETSTYKSNSRFAPNI